MSQKYLLTRSMRFGWRIFIGSLIVISLLGAYIGYRGKTTPYRYQPTRPHEEVSFLSLATDQRELNGWFFGANSPNVVILVHGWSGNRARLVPLAEYLNEHGFNVLTFDLRGGTGQNTYGEREAGDVAGAVAWLQDTMGYTSNNLSIVGNSIGGAAATLYTASHQVSSLVLVSPILDINSTKRAVLHDAHFILPGLYAYGTSLIERVAFNVKPVDAKTVLPNINVPTLLMYGTNDKIAPAAVVTKLQATLSPSAPVYFLSVPDGSHTFLDDDMIGRQEYTEQIYSFIQEHFVK